MKEVVISMSFCIMSDWDIFVPSQDLLASVVEVRRRLVKRGEERMTLERTLVVIVNI